MQFAAELRAHRGFWAKHPKSTQWPDTVALRIKQGSGAYAPRGDFHAVVRSGAVWASYLGPSDDARAEADVEP